MRTKDSYSKNVKYYHYIFIALLVVCIDQTSKLLVYHYMYIHEEINVFGDWFKIHYLLNPGMAFGIRWDNEFGKLMLTLFRIVAVGVIAYYMYWIAVKKKMHKGLSISISLILGGAIGNVIDSVFYGVLLNNSTADAPSPWFHGQVIDMLFFPLFEFYWPQWMPYWGGQYFLFFSPVFNVADTSIFMGVSCILLLQKKFFIKKDIPQISQPNRETPIQGDALSSD